MRSMLVPEMEPTVSRSPSVKVSPITGTYTAGVASDLMNVSLESKS